MFYPPRTESKNNSPWRGTKKDTSSGGEWTHNSSIKSSKGFSMLTMNLKEAKSFLLEANNPNPSLTIDDIWKASQWFKIKTAFVKLWNIQHEFWVQILRSRPTFDIIDWLYRDRCKRKLIIYDNINYMS